MCMKNINATAELFSSVENKDEIMSFSLPFDTIKAKIDENKAHVSDFSIVVSVNLLGTTQEDDVADNVVEQKIPLYCLVRLTKVCQDESKRPSWDIDTFTIDTNDKNTRFEKACVPSVNYRRIINVNQINLDEEYRGDYALKILVRKNEEDKWTVQSISRLTVI